jgi:nucleotide-binding universal stress UspA family protein
MFTNILVGVDGSEHALHAARLAGEMARRFNAQLWVVACFEPVPRGLGEPNLNDLIVERMTQCDKIVKEALPVIGEIPGELKTEILEGPAANAILTVAETRQVDLIIMGRRGLGQIAGLLLGSQSQKVVAQATCPVLVLR